MNHKSIIIFALLLFSNISNGQPRLLENVNHRISVIEYEEESEGVFIAWIVEDKASIRLAKKVRKLDLVESDKTGDNLNFNTYTDGSYEYVISKTKWPIIRNRFHRITVYSI